MKIRGETTHRWEFRNRLAVFSVRGSHLDKGKLVSTQQNQAKYYKDRVKTGQNSAKTIKTKKYRTNIGQISYWKAEFRSITITITKTKSQWQWQGLLNRVCFDDSYFKNYLFHAEVLIKRQKCKISNVCVHIGDMHC